MDETNNGEETTLESQEEVVEYQEEQEESIEDVKERLAKAEELARNQKIRAEKAEAKAKESGTPAQSQLSTRDAMALIEAKVTDEDIEEIEEYASFKKVSISEALKSPVMKTLLANKAEERRVAQGTNTGSTRRGTSTVSDDVLVARASKGEVPESDDDIRRLNAIRWGMKK